MEDPVPVASPTWKHDFDPSDWQIFQVHNASTIQVEFENMGYAGAGDLDTMKCELYGFPYLAFEICIAKLEADNHIVVGKDLWICN